MSISSVHLVAHYQELKVPTVVKKLARCLPVGDFLWLLKSGSEERLLGTIVERKTWTDLVQSIWDGRYYEQLNRMLITRGLTRVIYIIEGTVNDDRYSNLVKNAVRGLEARGVEVVRLNDIYETGRFLDQISTAFQSAQPSVDTLVGYDHFMAQFKRPKVGRERQRLVAAVKSCEGMGKVTASALLKFAEAHGGLSIPHLLMLLLEVPLNDFAKQLKDFAGLMRIPCIIDLERLIGRLLEENSNPKA